MALLTKTKYLAGLQCSKLLWTLINDKASIPEPDESQELIFDTGTDVGVLATSLYPEGIKVSEGNFMENINQTKTLLDKNKPLFEPGFMVDDLFSRGDILVPNDNDTWDIVEVKSSTKLKEVNIHDVSFQKLVYEKAGLKIDKCYVMHIDKTYVRNGDIEPEKLFIKEDITEQVKEFEVGIKERVKDMKAVLNGKKPKIDIGNYCNNPTDCSLTDDCWDFLPKGNVFDLTRGGKRSWELYSKNIIKIKDIPNEFKLSEKQEIQRQAALTGKPHVEPANIKKFIDGLNYPLYYFDFETINPAVPIFNGMSPYQKIPFQYSLHIQETEDGELKHVSFLADHKKDPREEILKSMQENLGTEGTILAWNQSFEIGVIKELVANFPEYEEWGSQTIKRVDDLIIPFRQFNYYNSIQKGSASLKNVLPALTDLSYDNLEIGNGADASSLYHRMVIDELQPFEVEKIRTDLETYCTQDTYAEVVILKELRKLV
jgi:hypothetical protein